MKITEAKIDSHGDIVIWYVGPRGEDFILITEYSLPTIPNDSIIVVDDEDE